jgi:predicted DCC family thiol-disulfide oxidoreductase YuxK
MDQAQLIVVYQGTCSFCNWCRLFVEERDFRKTCSFIALESDAGIKLIAEQGLVINQLRPESIVVLISGHEPYYEWIACLRIGEKLSSPWRQLAFAMHFIPTGIGNGIYRWASKHRGFLCSIVRCTK